MEKIKEDVQNLYEIKQKEMFSFEDILNFPDIQKSKRFNFEGNRSDGKIYFSTLVHPETKERLCKTFMERMYYILYNKNPNVYKVDRIQIAEVLGIPQIERIKDTEADSFNDSYTIFVSKDMEVNCFNNWVMSLNDDKEDIFLVSYFYSCMDNTYKKKINMVSQIILNFL